MEDQKIVDLYWERQESALLETQKKYGRHLFQLAYRILGNREDSAESVNEAYLKAWGSIPPQRPIALSPYLGKLARRARVISLALADPEEKEQPAPEEAPL